jgi:hypothetical protein
MAKFNQKLTENYLQRYICLSSSQGSMEDLSDAAASSYDPDYTRIA